MSFQFTSIRYCLIIFISSLSLLSGCSQQRITRLSPSNAVELSGNWNDTDSRLTTKTMVREILNSSRLKDFIAENKRPPRIIIGKFTNQSHEHIAMNTFLKELEKELINSGQIDFVASKKQRQEIREERKDYQKSYSGVDGIKIIPEKAADFILTGGIMSIQDQLINQKIISYHVSMELTDIRTNIKFWVGKKEIKKQIQKAKVIW